MSDTPQPAAGPPVKGLPMFKSTDPQALAVEKARLVELSKQGFLARCKGYWAMSGPGWMQSALTLGAGSASASLYAGVLMQYKILWVQPVAMFLGIVMFAAMAYQTLCTGARPFDAMRRYTHPALAWAWALASLAATIIWHLPQYALAGGVTEDMISAVSGWKPTGASETWLLLAIGFVYMLIAVFVTWSYGKSKKGVRLYERLLKYCVWLIVASFLAVVVVCAAKRAIDWKALGKGMLPLYFAGPENGEISVTIGALAAAVGINMTFLFPYTLLARGWGREHFGLAKFDLITGMMIPFVLATGLTIIAAGATIHGTPAMAEIIAKGKISAVQAASIFQAAGIHPLFSRIIFGLGILGMVTSSITMQMLVAGFAICEMFKVEPGGRLYKWACLIPTPAFIGVITWARWGPKIAVVASAVCGLLLPIAYVGIFWLNNSKAFLKDDKPRGVRALAWNFLMLAAIAVVTTSALYYTFTTALPFIRAKLGI